MKTCKKCGSAEFYSNGQCKPCHKLEKKEYNKKYRAENKDAVSETHRNYRKNNADKVAIQDKNYRLKNIEKVKQWKKEWIKNNPNAIKESSSRQYWKDVEKSRKEQNRRRKENPGLILSMNNNRRARIINSGSGKLSGGLFDKLFKLQKGKCACCHVDLKKIKPHLDHINPLAKGGSNADDNIQLLCATCNISKNDKHPIDFMQSRGYLL